ncbi:MAG: hypothetical protein RB292_02400 [Patescibacteria group bacterium]|jgi:hypothetical protein|nr:hypothetical protein [Patescibacteria group bacterium]
MNFRLKIVPVKNLVLHEDADQARIARYIKLFKVSGKLIDPPVVSPLAGGKFLVLDGANRTSVFKALGIPHIAVQVVDYFSNEVNLSSWNHLICHQDFVCQNKKKIIFKKNQLAEMSQFVKQYNGKYQINRLDYDNSVRIKKEYGSNCCLIVFPKFTKSDIFKFAKTNQHIPSGITRHLVNGRVLNLNLNLSFLKSKTSLAGKQKKLDELIKRKLNKHNIRHYVESVNIIY